MNYNNRKLSAKLVHYLTVQALIRRNRDGKHLFAEFAFISRSHRKFPASFAHRRRLDYYMNYYMT